MNSNISVDSFIQALDVISESLTYDVFLPCLQKHITLKYLNTQQFNKIITQFVLDNNTTNKTIVEILQSNLLTKDILIKDISVFDYAILLLNTKKICMNDELTVLFTPSEIEQFNLQPYNKYSITELLELKKDILPVPPLTSEIDGFVITCSLPTVYRELESLITHINDTENSKNIETAFFTALIKYINDIRIGDNTFNFFEHPLQAKIEIVQRLPAHVVNNIIKTIEKLKQPLTDLITIQIKDDQDVLVIEKEIPLSGDLFNF